MYKHEDGRVHHNNVMVGMAKNDYHADYFCTELNSVQNKADSFEYKAKMAKSEVYMLRSVAIICVLVAFVGVLLCLFL